MDGVRDLGQSGLAGDAERSARDRSARSRRRMSTASTAASTAVAAKFSHSPVRPRGQRIKIRRTGKKSAVETEMMDAWRDFSTASR